MIRDSALSVNQILHSPYNKLNSINGEETKTEVTIFQLVEPCYKASTSILITTVLSLSLFFPVMLLLTEHIEKLRPREWYTLVSPLQI